MCVNLKHYDKHNRYEKIQNIIITFASVLQEQTNLWLKLGQLLPF